MTSRWSWIFIFHVLLCSKTLAQSNNGTDATTDTYRVTTANLPPRPEVVGPIIAGVIVAVFVVVLIIVMTYFYFRGPPAAELEDGVTDEKPPLSGRKWFSSKSGRFRNDDPNQQPVKKLSAVPRYLRAFRKSAGWSDQPVPHTPVVPRSARLVAGDSMFTLSLPASASPTTNDPFNQMDRSDRRKVQVAAQPIAQLPRMNSPRRKQSILPNFMRGGKQPVQRNEIVQKLIEKQAAVAELEEKGRRHAHQAHGSISSTSTSSTCVVDEQIEQDITELRQEVKVLEKMLPECNAAPPMYI